MVMVRKILIASSAIVAVFLIVVATRPATFHIERSVTIAAPAEAAFAQVDDFHAWSAWSPWEKMDPDMKRTFEGAPSGRGAKYAWAGNDKVGEGRMTIEKSDRPSKIVINLEFIKPWTATNTATFAFAPAGTGVNVTWAMDGENNFMAKGASLFMDMDKMVGGDFERGLAALKSAAESAPKSGTARAVP
jgi:surface antigen